MSLDARWYVDQVTEVELSGYMVLLSTDYRATLIAKFMGPTWGPSGANRTQVGPMLAPLTLLSG